MAQESVNKRICRNFLTTKSVVLTGFEGHPDELNQNDKQSLMEHKRV